jgi:hypothetical protein
MLNRLLLFSSLGAPSRLPIGACSRLGIGGVYCEIRGDDELLSSRLHFRDLVAGNGNPGGSVQKSRC